MNNQRKRDKTKSVVPGVGFWGEGGGVGVVKSCLTAALSVSLRPSVPPSGLPAEELHEALVAVLAEEIEGALSAAQVNQEKHQQQQDQEGDQQVPARRQDVVPLGLVRALAGRPQVPQGHLVPSLRKERGRGGQTIRHRPLGVSLPG